MAVSSAGPDSRLPAATDARPLSAAAAAGAGTAAGAAAGVDATCSVPSTVWSGHWCGGSGLLYLINLRELRTALGCKNMPNSQNCPPSEQGLQGQAQHRQLQLFLEAG